ncbi:unnamed protein product [Pleuronectes platessa]|uniref:Rhodanese domain-containing protein n=1 Tax=Pleuronectes platessa TaxID=8262 RepID=A0A9N7UFY6_PLEPL|nr:unnamed protein product [Pleuronectes platessa]
MCLLDTNKYYSYRADEVFKRLKVSSFAQLILQVASVSDLNKYENDGDSHCPDDALSEMSDADLESLSKGALQMSPLSDPHDAGDTRENCYTSRSTLLRHPPVLQIHPPIKPSHVPSVMGAPSFHMHLCPLQLQQGPQECNSIYNLSWGCRLFVMVKVLSKLPPYTIIIQLRAREPSCLERKPACILRLSRGRAGGLIGFDSQVGAAHIGFDSPHLAITSGLIARWAPPHRSTGIRNSPGTCTIEISAARCCAVLRGAARCFSGASASGVNPAVVVSGVGELSLDKKRHKMDDDADRPYPDCPYLLLDVRDLDQYNRCHIISAHSFPIAHLSRTMNSFTKDKNTAGKFIIVYDENERIASQAATTMCQRGVENLFMLSGGLKVIAQKFPEGLTTGSIPITCLSSPTLSKGKKGAVQMQAAEMRRRFTSDELTKIQEQLEEILIPSNR